MTDQDSAINSAFDFFYSDGCNDGYNEFEPGWYCREGFDGGPVDEDCHGPWSTQFKARQAMRQVFFV